MVVIHVEIVGKTGADSRDFRESVLERIRRLERRVAGERPAMRQI